MRGVPSRAIQITSPAFCAATFLASRLILLPSAFTPATRVMYQGDPCTLVSAPMPITSQSSLTHFHQLRSLSPSGIIRTFLSPLSKMSAMINFCSPPVAKRLATRVPLGESAGAFIIGSAAKS
jgi:hypothetical protein